MLVDILPYFLLLFAVTALTALAVESSGGRTDSFHILDGFALILLVAFAGSRIGVGTDFELYERVFARVDPTNWADTISQSPQDFGFTTLSLLVAQVGGDFSTLIWVVSILTVVPTYVALRRTSVDPTLTIYLFVALGTYLTPFNIMRQGIAAGLVFIAALWFLDEKRRWPGFFGLMFLAATFHATALLAGAIMFVARNWRPNLGTAALVIGGAAIAATVILGQSALDPILNAINPRYAGYTERDAAGIGTYLVIAAKAGLLMICWLKVNQLSDIERRYFVYSLAGLAFLIIGTQSIAISRLELYFGVFLLLLVPSALTKFTSAAPKVAIYAGAAVYLFAFLAEYNGLLPYTSSVFRLAI